MQLWTDKQLHLYNCLDFQNKSIHKENLICETQATAQQMSQSPHTAVKHVQCYFLSRSRLYMFTSCRHLIDNSLLPLVDLMPFQVLMIICVFIQSLKNLSAPSSSSRTSALIPRLFHLDMLRRNQSHFATVPSEIIQNLCVWLQN